MLAAAAPASATTLVDVERVAAELAGPTVVECVLEEDWAARFPAYPTAVGMGEPGHVALRERTCAFLLDPGSPAHAWGVFALAHELWHARGVRDEGTASCLALGDVRRIARRLGATPARARGLQWDAIRLYPQLPESHRLAGPCPYVSAARLRAR